MTSDPTVYRTALIVENDNNELDHSKTVMESVGFSVICSCTGFDAVKCFQRDMPEVVLISYNLTDKHALEIIKMLKNINDSVQIFILLKDLNSVVLLDGFYYGATGFFKKPLVKDDLIKKFHGKSNEN